jgi:hypothetical protein
MLEEIVENTHKLLDSVDLDTLYSIDKNGMKAF